MKDKLSILAALYLLLPSTPVLIASDDHLPEVETLQPGVTLTMIAEQPDIVTPIGLDVDDQGRVWLISSNTHMPPRGYQGPSHDQILMFDKKGKRHLFYEKTDLTMDLEFGADGWIYLSERDRILRIKDSNGDGKGDTEETLITLDSEADYPHNAVSGIAWDPTNGDLIFGLGENFAKAWTLTAHDGKTIQGAARGGVFRCKADGSDLRQIAEGLWNPFGITVRKDGEIFTAENDPGEHPPCKVLHIVQDGDYGFRRQYGSEAHHPFVSWNGEGRGTLPMIHPSGEAPCGIVPLGRGLLVPSWGDHRIDFFPLTPKGASYTAKQITLAHGSRYFRPACIARDKSSSNQDTLVWYLTDWVDGRYPVHGYGRLWKMQIDLKKAKWVGPLDLEDKNSAAQLATQLRQSAKDFTLDQLFTYSRDQDPFIATAAMSSLTRVAKDWKPEGLLERPAINRIQAVQALKKSHSQAKLWINKLLADESPAVQFETLRWIADEELKDFLPQVDQILKSNKIDYEVFEAALAARNTLLGKSDIGVRDKEALLSRALDPSTPPAIRTYALRLLPARQKNAPKNGATPPVKIPKALTLDVLKEMLSSKHLPLTLEALRTLASNPQWGQALLAETARNEKFDIQARCEAISGLASVAAQHTELLIRLTADAHQELRESALRALRSTPLDAKQTQLLKKAASQHPDSAPLFAALLEPSSLMSGRPALTDTAAWLKRLDAIKTPADIQAGRRIFNHSKIALCSNCHRYGGRGNVVGPDLSKVADRSDRAWLLEAILNPNKDVAPEFLPRMITLNNGEVYTGIRLRSYVNEQIRDARGLNYTFKRDEVKSIQDLPMSFMPGGLPLTLTDRELRDLIAFLESSSAKR
ncbi:MAG: c-type cytochrome [Verrucomicrobiales bacterium]|nr:c-type cytochrome [Verrucomicrobiales bacterium]